MDISFKSLAKCLLCPRNCGVDRFAGSSGYCHSDYHYNISAVVAHHGEEPVISGKHGICNIFFSHCNLQCVYCQNFQISQNASAHQPAYRDVEKILADIQHHLNSGCRAIGFVSPSHQIPQMASIIRAFEHHQPRPVFVYNSNGYDKVETLRKLEGLIDIYLPDLKYMDAGLALTYSDAKDYPEVAQKGLKEMFRQKGAALHYLDTGQAESGIIIRHLVLPGHIQNSLDVLHFIAEELSPKIHVSLMSQYYPVYKATENDTINRSLSRKEYDTVVNEAEKLGLTRGWIQELSSHDHYRPDFRNTHPFENT
ncbi:MAG TPA: 4Fe-4S cluster-binding domain-containing protein [Bacteroidales bacterium]|nr:4Fe-4S cluster-binding domain-containing protein [Bacteroidales bacterium]